MERKNDEEEIKRIREGRKRKKREKDGDSTNANAKDRRKVRERRESLIFSRILR